MKKILSTLILSTLALGIFGQPLLASAQATPVQENPVTSPFTAINCAELATAEKANEDLVAASAVGVESIHTMVNGFLNNLLVGHSLHYRLRCSPLITGIDEQGNRVTSAYNVAKNLVNFGVLLVLLVIAFANILRIKLDTYAVKKAVPLLLFGVVMANLGMPIIRTIVDFSEVLTATFIGQSSAAGTKTAFVEELISAVYKGGVKELGTVINQLSSGGSNGWPAAMAIVGIASFGVAALGPFAVIVLVGGIFLLLLPALMFFALGLLFVARVYYIVILASASPLAFASLGFEPLRGKIWGWWWSHFIKWVFMAPATFALFWLGIVFFHSVGSTMDLGTYILILFLVYYATQIPLKMGGSVLGAWNNSFAKPLGAALNRPFTAARDYAAKAGPRDISRFLSSPPERLARILPGRTLNYGRYTREALAQIEARNAQREASSAAVRGGKMAGQFVNSVGVINAARSPRTGGQRFAEGALRTEEGRRNVSNLARDIFRTMSIDPSKVKYDDLDDNQKTQLNNELLKMRDSKDREKVQAAVLANAMIGRDLKYWMPNNDASGWGGYSSALKQTGVDQKGIDTLSTMYKDQLSRKLGRPVAGLSGATGSERLAEEIASKIGSVTNGRDSKRSEELLESIGDYLKKVVTELKTLEDIQKDPNAHGYIKGALEAADRGNTQAIRLVQSMNLDRFRDGLGMPNVQVIFNDMPAGSPVQFTRNDQPHVANAFSGDGLSDQQFVNMSPSAQEAVQKLWSDAAQPITKKYLEGLIEKALNNTFRAQNDSTLRMELKRQLTEDLIGDDPDRAPVGVDEQELADMINNRAGRTTPVNEEKIRELASQLRTFRAGARTIQTLHTRRKAAEEAATQAATGGGDTTAATAPTSGPSNFNFINDETKP
jgi:hypothetical protein